MTPNYQCWISTRIKHQLICQDPIRSHRISPQAHFWQLQLRARLSPEKKNDCKNPHKNLFQQISWNKDPALSLHTSPKITKFRWSRDNERYLSHSFYYLPQARPPVIRYGTLHWHVAPRVWQLQQRISSRSAATALIASWTWNPKHRRAHLKKCHGNHQIKLLKKYNGYRNEFFGGVGGVVKHC